MRVAEGDRGSCRVLTETPYDPSIASARGREAMAQTAIKDVVIWTKHIHGADQVREHVVRLRGGETIDLVIDGWRGPWRRMSDGKDGRPTLGIRPIGKSTQFWSELYAARRGELVGIEVADARTSEPKTIASGPSSPTDASRAAARAALLEGLFGFRSEGAKLSRDDLHDRSQDR